MASYFSEGAVSVLSDGAAGAQAQVALWIAEAETEGAWFTEKCVVTCFRVNDSEVAAFVALLMPCKCAVSSSVCVS